MTSSAKEGARGRRRTRAAITTAAALMGTAALASPAGAAVAPVPTLPHSIISFPQRDFVSADGFTDATSVTVRVIRNGVTIATSDPIVPDAATGLVEVNHPGGGCWVGTTPDILPGDEIMTTPDVGVSEATTTANVTAGVGQDVGGDIVVHGTAQDAAGKPLPIDQIEQRLVANRDAFDANGRRTLRADAAGTGDGTLAYDPVDAATNPKGINWTATYKGLDNADRARGVSVESRILWLGANPASGQELTIYENAPDGSIVAGPSAPCTAPFVPNAIGAVEMNGSPVKVINQANAGGTLTVSGPIDPDPAHVTDVAVTVGGVAATATHGAGSAAWSATVPAADLPEGDLTIRAAFTGPAGAPDSTATIVKDTVAPAAPTANLASGTYAGPQTVILSAAPGATIRFTGDGSTPTATSGAIFTSPFSVTASQTITAVAVDNHGNASAPRTFTYTIAGAGTAANPAPKVVPGIGQVVAPGQIQVQGATASSPLVVSRLTLARRISITRLRVQGLRTSMNVQEGTNVVRIAIYKARNGAKTGRALFTTTRTPRAAGLFRTTLRSSKLSKLKPGAYVMEVRAGRSAATLGKVTRVVFTVTR